MAKKDGFEGERLVSGRLGRIMGRTDSPIKILIREIATGLQPALGVAQSATQQHLSTK
jgi:hypothetical protein